MTKQGDTKKSGRKAKAKPGRARRGRPAPAQDCPLCGRPARLFRSCRHCGFEMCQDCTDANLWGITCNHITWTCPDCGEANSF